MSYSTKESNEEANYFEDAESGTLWRFDNDPEMQITHSEMYAFYGPDSDHYWDIKETSIILKLGQMATLNIQLLDRTRKPDRRKLFPRYKILALDYSGDPTIGWIVDPDVLVPYKGM